jgi:hypothetical protein
MEEKISKFSWDEPLNSRRDIQQCVMLCGPGIYARFGSFAGQRYIHDLGVVHARDIYMI